MDEVEWPRELPRRLVVINLKVTVGWYPVALVSFADDRRINSIGI